MSADTFDSAALAAAPCPRYAHRGLVEVDWDAYRTQARLPRTQGNHRPQHLRAVLSLPHGRRVARLHGALSWPHERPRGHGGNSELGPYREGSRIFSLTISRSTSSARRAAHRLHAQLTPHRISSHNLFSQASHMGWPVRRSSRANPLIHQERRRHRENHP